MNAAANAHRPAAPRGAVNVREPLEIVPRSGKRTPLNVGFRLFGSYFIGRIAESKMRSALLDRIWFTVTAVSSAGGSKAAARYYTAHGTPVNP